MNSKLQSIYEKMHGKLHSIVPDVELRLKAELAEELYFKTQKNAVILGHVYMEPALYHSIPDHVGDSLALARKAATTDEDIIVFCGVRFMDETAKILSSEKVLVPSLGAGCSLAESMTADDVRKLRKQYIGVPYVNTYADVQAESGICCTSGNANAVVESLNTDTVFLTDEFMAGNIAREAGIRMIFPTKNPQDLDKRSKDLDYTIIG